MLRLVLDKDDFNGSTLTGDKRDFEAGRGRVIAALEANLQGRFDDTNEGVMKASRIANWQLWPTTTSEDKILGMHDQ